MWFQSDSNYFLTDIKKIAIVNIYFGLVLIHLLTHHICIFYRFYANERDRE